MRENDFVIVSGFSYQSLGDVSALAKKMCDRHYGAGADGLIWLCPSPVAAANVRIFNSDGSEAETCGNGVRCAAKYLYDSGLARSGEMRLQTLAGVISARVGTAGVTVDMGVPRFERAGRFPFAAAAMCLRFRQAIGRHSSSAYRWAIRTR